MLFLQLIGIGILLTLVAGYIVIKKKNMDIWLWGYISHHITKKTAHDGPTHVLFCFVDHYEPQWKTDDINVERSRVDRWLNDCVPIGARLAFNSTAALSSNLIKLPSGRRNPFLVRTTTAVIT